MKLIDADALRERYQFCHDALPDGAVPSKGQLLHDISMLDTAPTIACDCAEYALRYARDDQRELLQACLDVTTAYAEYGQEWSAARSAARSAAWSAAESAAEDELRRILEECK